MEKLNIKGMKCLLGLIIKDIGRTFILSEDYNAPLLDTLYLNCNKNTIIQFLKANQDGLYIQKSFSQKQPIIDPDYEIEVQEKLFLKSIEVSKLSLPSEIASITEYWSGSEIKPFMIGFTLHSKNQEVLIYIFTETDEIELLDYESFRHRVENIPFYYEKLSVYWYEK